ncbi:MAG: tetratricopeptide repeat protein [Pirellulales bacterium]|nr:tetratricopeptide repeat protein [Pirellulales bacterium]
MERQHGQSLPGEREDLQAVEAIEQGIQHLENNEQERAIECFTEAIRLNPECARAYLLRGEVYSKTGNWARAERDVAKARRAEARQ